MTIEQLAPHVDRLNSWVRSQGAREWFSSPMRAIYDFKFAIIRRAFIEGRCQHGAIYLSLNCRDCGGSRRYTDSYGHTWPHCRKCSSMGVVRLTFLVTEVAGFNWHTPWNRTYSLPLAHVELEKSATLSADWEPNGTGRELELWQIAESLNVLEAEMPTAVGYHGVYDNGDWYGDKKHSDYRLNLGRVERSTCELCESSAEKKNRVVHHVMRKHIEWSAWACSACCAAHAGDSPTIFSLFAVPVEHLKHPAVQTWLERRNAQIGVAA